MRVSPQRTVVPALQALRAYWGTAILVVAACVVGLGVMLPVTATASWGPSGVAPTLGLPPVRSSDFGIVWGAFAQSPSMLRQAAVAALVRLLLGVGVGVLAVTWLTTLSVSTARADARAAEVPVRRAVGASRRSLVASALLEGGAIAVLALVVGGAAGLVAARLALGAWPGTAGPGSPELGLVAVAATLGGVVLGALFPLVFARRSSRIAVVDPTPLGLVVPAAQLGLSLTVLATASLLSRGAARLTGPARAPSGRGIVFEISGGAPRAAVRAAEYAALLRGLARDPLIRVASLTSPGAASGIGTVDIAMSDCGECSWGGLALPFHRFFATHYVVSADTFRALGLRVTAGRGLDDGDDYAAPLVAVVSRSVAVHHFQRGEAVGRRIQIGHGPGDWYTVVGVVEDQRPAGVGGGLEPSLAVYLSVLQHPGTAVDLLVRGSGDPRALGRRVGRAVTGTLRAPTIRTVRASEADLLAAEAAPLRWFAALSGVEGWALLAIATIGTFAMMWLWVTSLAGELGIRRAVGARRRHVLGYVLSRAALVAAGGVAFGTWLGMIAWDALGSVVAGLPPWDPAAVARYGALLAVAALAGATLPAWRAARASPAALFPA
jgi:putative ABC transport system permease protein